MSSLSSSYIPIFESLFEMKSGYVLDFSNLSFKNFVCQNTNLDIYDDKYSENGDSKAKRLREFIRIEPDHVVGNLLISLLEYCSTMILVGNRQNSNPHLISECRNIANKLLSNKIQTEYDLIQYKFEKLPINSLNIDSTLINIFEQRVKEIEICLEHNAALACIFLCGSTLEGILSSLATQKLKDFNMSPSSPKDKLGKTKSLDDWTLNDLINVSHNIGLIDLNVKNFSHAVRGFRNYIHPSEQIRSKFNPDIHTAGLSYKVLQLTIFQLTKTRY